MINLLTKLCISELLTSNKMPASVVHVLTRQCQSVSTQYCVLFLQLTRLSTTLVTFIYAGVLLNGDNLRLFAMFRYGSVTVSTLHVTG